MHLRQRTVYFATGTTPEFQKCQMYAVVKFDQSMVGYLLCLHKTFKIGFCDQSRANPAGNKRRVKGFETYCDVAPFSPLAIGASF